MKCSICGKPIGETFLGKLNGTIVKINKQGKNRVYYACSDCQEKYRDKLEEKIEGE